LHQCVNGYTEISHTQYRRDKVALRITCIQGCSASQNGVGTNPRNSHFWNSFQLILKQNVKKECERRSHAFPPHYTPACIKHVKFKIIKIRTGCQYVGYSYYSANLNWAAQNAQLGRGLHIAGLDVLLLQKSMRCFFQK